jgi:hypothetical protein
MNFPLTKPNTSPEAHYNLGFTEALEAHYNLGSTKALEAHYNLGSEEVSL